MPGSTFLTYVRVHKRQKRITPHDIGQGTAITNLRNLPTRHFVRQCQHRHVVIRVRLLQGQNTLWVTVTAANRIAKRTWGVLLAEHPLVVVHHIFGEPGGIDTKRCYQRDIQA